MTLRTSLPVLLITISTFCVSSQDRGIDILSDIISTSAVATAQTADVMTLGMSGTLDLIGTPAGTTVNAGAPSSPLDYVTTSVNPDVYTDLVGLYSRQPHGSGTGALDMISGAYNANGFYQSGIFDNMELSNYIHTSPMHPAIGTETYYCPEGLITSGFGYRPKFKRMHKGIDIAMSVGDTVRVALPGVVERVAYEAKGYGNYIIVRHDDGIETRYAHLSTPLVTVGQRVMASEAIGLSGNTGNSTGPHLHFETRYQGVAVDPTAVFNFSGNHQPGFYNSPGVNPPQGTLATGFNSSKKSLAAKSTYVVIQGDTPQTIAARAGISVYRLCQLNFITESQKLVPGTMLKLK